MAAADNPFFIQPANPLAALMTGVEGYDRATKRSRENQMLEGRQRAMTALQSGGDLRSPLAELLGIGDVEGAKAVSQFAEHQANRQFRETEADRAQSNADRMYKLQVEGAKVPPGFRPTEAGGLAPVAGGPADPAYLTAATEAKAKPRELSLTDISKLTEEGGKFANIATFKDTFEPRFAGYKTEGVGNAATFLGRNVPGMVSKDTVDAAQWWQGYDRFKNVVRNELFGAALTATEKAAFERADINAGMDPATVQKNLEMQHRIARNGLIRKADAAVAAGYDPAVIAKAYGLRLEELGIAATGRRGSTPSTTTPGGKNESRVAPLPPGAPMAPAQAPVDWTQYFGAGR